MSEEKEQVDQAFLELENDPDDTYILTNLVDELTTHQAVEWRTVCTATVEPEYANGDPTYHELYDLIRAAHLIALVDDTVAKNL